MYCDAGTLSVIVVAAVRALAGIRTDVPPRLKVAPSVVTRALVVCVCVVGHCSSVGELGDGLAVESPPQLVIASASDAIATMRETVDRDLGISEAPLQDDRFCSPK